MKTGGYEVIQIDSSSWRIEDTKVRAFLFTGTEKALLVDSTTGSGDLAAVVRELTSLPVMLVNTHADEDHIGCNTQFSETHMHPAEFAYYAEMRKPGSARPLPLQDGEVIDIGGRQFETILIPGHTYGSIALLDRANRLLVSGDAISSTPVFIFGRMRNLEAFQVSLRRLQSMGDAFDIVYPSHGVFPIRKNQIDNELACADRLQRGELAPMEPPFPMPAKMYRSDDAGFYSFEVSGTSPSDQQNS